MSISSETSCNMFGTLESVGVLEVLESDWQIFFLLFFPYRGVSCFIVQWFGL